MPNGEEVAACGIVTLHQQPQTARGPLFVTLEDETGPVNVIARKPLRETPARRGVVRTAVGAPARRLLAAAETAGHVQP